MGSGYMSNESHLPLLLNYNWFPHSRVADAIWYQLVTFYKLKQDDEK